MKREAILFVAVFVAAFAVFGAVLFHKGSESPSMQQARTPPPALQEPLTPVETATATRPKPIEGQGELPTAGITRQPDETAIAKLIVEQNESWLFLRDSNGAIVKDSSGKRKLSPAGERYSYYVAVAEKRGITGVTAQHDWAIAMLVTEVKQMQTAPRTPVVGTEWEYVEETSIAGSISGSIRKGTIFKTATGGIFEVTDYVYLYEYEYSPKVLVLRKGESYKLIIDGVSEALVCRRLNSTPTGTTKGPSPESPAVIESTITSEFNGFKHGNIYRLANGQIWEQTEVYIWVWVWVNPKVLIWNDGGIYRMKVEGIDHPVMVRRIR
jgi:hypothetical protein